MVNIKLPEPKLRGKLSVEEALLRRRSIRKFSEGKLTLEEISQILWAAQGITDEKWGFRTAPSAGALYPIEVYVVMQEGVFHYDVKKHFLQEIKKGDARKELCKACLSQGFIETAPLTIVISAVFERTCSKYGERGIRYVFIEAGHVSQNIYLQCESLGLATVAMGAFYDSEVKKVLELPRNHEPIYIMPVGKR